MDGTKHGTVARVLDSTATVLLDGDGAAECEALVDCSVGDRVMVALRGSEPTGEEGKGTGDHA